MASSVAPRASYTVVLHHHRRVHGSGRWAGASPCMPYHCDDALELYGSSWVPSAGIATGIPSAVGRVP